MMQLGIKAMELGLLPDFVLRKGIAYNCRQRLREFENKSVEQLQEDFESFIAELRGSPIALVPEAANEQHYEVSAEFFQLVLGPHLKYSSGLFKNESSTLAEAEEHMLAATTERLNLQDGQKVLELGCGWGSLTLWLAAHFPNSKITGVSNSASQREFIMGQAQKRGLSNVQIITADMNQFQAPDKYDRIVSVEMFEHMRNYQMLLGRCASWLKADGRLLIHIFCHKLYAYPYETEGADNWMGRHFFSGGIMPSRDLLGRFNNDMKIEKQWLVSGTHYAKTAEAWAQNMLSRREEVLSTLANIYGKSSATRWFYMWRTFFLACAELFNYNNGHEWMVTHIRFVKAVD